MSESAEALTAVVNMPIFEMDLPIFKFGTVHLKVN
jgi:hypothetical protein